jgi:tetratricopeptide (TPR) repeat protein
MAAHESSPRRLVSRCAGRGRRRLGGAVGACVVALALVVEVGAVTPPTSGPVGEAWKMLITFHEDRGRLDRARALLESEVARTPTPTLEALLLLSWVHLAWADYRADTTDAKLASYERGRDAAKRAIDLAPRSPEAHLWYAANLGRWAITKGKLRAAFLLSILRGEIDTILELDPNHVPGLALAGSFYLETPAIFGGDVPRAEGYLRKALTVDPHFTRARVELSRCLIALRRYDEAKVELKRIIDERQPSYPADWVMRHRPTAERLLTEIRAR